MRNEPPISISSPRLMMHFLALGHGVERQHQRRRGIVHHQRVGGAGEPRELRAAVVGPAAPRAAVQVELERAVAGGDRTARR